MQNRTRIGFVFRSSEGEGRRRGSEFIKSRVYLVGGDDLKLTYTPAASHGCM